jgi:hypothetical protein
MCLVGATRLVGRRDSAFTVPQRGRARLAREAEPLPILLERHDPIRDIAR